MEYEDVIDEKVESDQPRDCALIHHNVVQGVAVFYLVFAPQQLVPSEDAQTVVVRGRLRTLVNGFETANDLKAYLVEFSYSGARMHLKTFKELPSAK